MTLIVALKGRISKTSKTEGVVITSDTQASSNVKSPIQKVFQINGLPMLVRAAGSISLSRRVIQGLERMSRRFHKNRKAEMLCEDFE